MHDWSDEEAAARAAAEKAAAEQAARPSAPTTGRRAERVRQLHKQR